MWKDFLIIFLTLFLLVHLKKSDSLLSLVLNYEGLENKEGWEKAGVLLPSYDAKKLAEKTKQNPIWVHFGIGNIFRFFIGGIADKLISENILDKGITCVEAFDYEVVDNL